MQSRVMYIERHGGLARDGGRIGRVYFSKTGKSIRYRGVELRTLKGRGYKANYFDTDSGSHYWVSGPRKDGNDPLYADTVEIDDDVNEEYWINIRGLPEYVGTVSYRAPGKYLRSGKREKRPAGVVSAKRKRS